MTQVNAIKVTLYDNLPINAANRWYDYAGQKEEFKSRFKLNFSFLTEKGSINLTGTLQWPPRNLSRRGSVVKHEALYTKWIDYARTIQADIRSGRINSSLPPLLTILSETKSINTQKKNNIFKWLVPDIPSMIIAIKVNNGNNSYWDIHWLTPQDTYRFKLANDIDTQVVEDKNKNGGSSIRISRLFNQRYDLPDDLYRPKQADYQMKTLPDDDYQIFLRQINELRNLPDNALTRGEFSALVIRHPQHAERWNKEN